MQIEIPDYMIKEIKKINEKVTVYKDETDFVHDAVRTRIFVIISWIREGH